MAGLAEIDADERFVEPAPRTLRQGDFILKLGDTVTAEKCLENDYPADGRGAIPAGWLSNSAPVIGFLTTSR
jgi:hypothetical protein